MLELVSSSSAPSSFPVSLQKDPRPFDPALGDQAVKLLDKVTDNALHLIAFMSEVYTSQRIFPCHMQAIHTFRERRAAVMQQLDDDVQTIKWSNHEIAWIDKKVTVR